jgi:hypothetical protein
VTLPDDVGSAAEDVASWLAEAHADAIDGIAVAYQARGGAVAHDTGPFPPPGAIGTTCVKRLRSGRLAASSLVGNKWNRLLADLTADRLAEVSVTIYVAARDRALADQQRWGHMQLRVRLQRDHYQGEPRIELAISEPLLRLVGPDKVIDVLRRATTLLPVTSGSIRFSRNLSFGPWVYLAPPAVDTDSIMREGLAAQALPITNPAGELIWLQATHKLDQLRTDQARRLSDALGLDPVSFNY